MLTSGKMQRCVLLSRPEHRRSRHRHVKHRSWCRLHKLLHSCCMGLAERENRHFLSSRYRRSGPFRYSHRKQSEHRCRRIWFWRSQAVQGLWSGSFPFHRKSLPSRTRGKWRSGHFSSRRLWMGIWYIMSEFWETVSLPSVSASNINVR